MTPLYFGDSSKPLFGIHHQPTSSQYQDSSIVICNPIGFEYGRAHSTIKTLAKKLAQKGYHVLRFDYFATGDSSGYSHEMSIQQCIQDIELSCEEMKAISATRKITVIGYRLGAALAAYTSESYNIKRLILWDAVFNGKNYLEKLQLMHNRMLQDANRFDLKHILSEENTTELIGYDFTAALRGEISSIDLKTLEKIKSRKIDVFCYQDGECVDKILHNDNFLSMAAIHKLDGNVEWENIDKIESRVLVASSLDKIVEVVG